MGRYRGRARDGRRSHSRVDGVGQMAGKARSSSKPSTLTPTGAAFATNTRAASSDAFRSGESAKLAGVGPDAYQRAAAQQSPASAFASPRAIDGLTRHRTQLAPPDVAGPKDPHLV